ncbi:MAG TPA: CRISPR-associated endonuclease Cas2 [Leptospiraceae bacterium]|nr:CRISPR-associated endonuclease Cas2 [Leptospiraceae bacterium]
MQQGKLYLICYDFPSGKMGDKRRAKVVKILQGYGNRVQKSVFELRLHKKEELDHMLKKIKKWFIDAEDSLRIYPLNELAEREIQIHGEGEIYKVDDAYFF